MTSGYWAHHPYRRESVLNLEGFIGWPRLLRIVEEAGSPRNKAFLATLFETGGRVSEVLRLKIENFELLEDERVRDFSIVRRFITKVKSYGVKIAIDDFGAGYSNYERLLAYEPDILKIDGSLIKNIENSIDVFSKACPLFVPIVEEGWETHHITKDIIKAIGRGFSPEKALLLFNDDYYFELLDIRDWAGKRSSHIKRLAGRVIGKDGKARRVIEEITGAYVAIYGHTVAIIGRMDEIEFARRAIEMLLEGANHSTVYRYLEKERRKKKLEEFGLWEKGV